MAAILAVDALPQTPLPAFLPSWEQVYDALAQHLVRGNRRGDLMILNYTQKTVYDRRFDHPAAKACRGLVVNTATGEVVALPFAKFFNFGEQIAEGRIPALPEGVEPEYTEKLDGALGICYRHPEGTGDILWTTRGSFDSEQGKAAQEIWDRRYDTPWRRNLLNNDLRELTLMVEIIHPVTRQVVKYGEEDLVIIGARDRTTGADWKLKGLQLLGDILQMPVAQPLTPEQLANPARTGIIEGLVARYDVRICPLCDAWKPECPLCAGRRSPVYRLKFKTAEYLKLHRIKMRCSPRQITRAWVDGSLALFLPQVPEEWRDEVEQTVAALNTERERRQFTLEVGYHDRAPLGEDRKTFALWVTEQVRADERGHYFRLYDGKPLQLEKEVAEWYRQNLPPELWTTEDE